MEEKKEMIYEIPVLEEVKLLNLVRGNDGYEDDPGGATPTGNPSDPVPQGGGGED